MSVRVDDVLVRLREYHDLAFLSRWGRVFAAFDQQDSGNLAFGVQNGAQRVFVKYAGAKPEHYDGHLQAAVERLRQATTVLEALQHPTLVPMREHFPVGDGYAVVYDWFPGECLHAHWAFAPQQKYADPESPSYRFRRMPVERRMAAFHAVLEFHEYVARRGYVAIDFYDGNILYNFARHETRVCDIDFYCASPVRNDMGRMWGSSRFMSPEEYELGAEIDEVTNVFTMGATALELLGGDVARGEGPWAGSAAQLDVVRRATNPDRARRYPSLVALHAAWDEASS